MDYRVFGLIEIVIFLGMFMMATYLLLPKAVIHFRLWKKTGKTIYLSSSFSGGIAILFLLTADFIMFIRIFMQGGMSN